MSLCDTCHSPGNCCKSMWLRGGLNNVLGSADATDLEIVDELDYIRSYYCDEDHTFPFILFGRDEFGNPKYMCPELGNDGRCKVYDKRPDVCRNYEPASDSLCVYYKREEPDVWGLT